MGRTQVSKQDYDYDNTCKHLEYMKHVATNLGLKFDALDWQMTGFLYCPQCKTALDTADLCPEFNDDLE